MTETEQLKKNADQSRTMQNIQAVQEYLNRLTADIDAADKRYKDASILYWCSWMAWMVSAFFVDLGVLYVFLCVFVIAYAYHDMRFARLMKAYGTFFGAVEVLRLLGFIDLPDARERKDRKFFEEGVAMVKRWFTEKKQAQEKVYKPA